MSFDTTARQWVAPKAEKHEMPACLPLVSFTGDERATMINPYHANIIDRLRDASKEHGEVADLLQVLAESFPYFVNGDSSFQGGEKSRAYLLAAINAASFVAVDLGVLDQEEE